MCEHKLAWHWSTTVLATWELHRRQHVYEFIFVFLQIWCNLFEKVIRSYHKKKNKTLDPAGLCLYECRLNMIPSHFLLPSRHYQLEDLKNFNWSTCCFFFFFSPGRYSVPHLVTFIVPSAPVVLYKLLSSSCVYNVLNNHCYFSTTTRRILTRKAPSSTKMLFPQVGKAELMMWLKLDLKLVTNGDQCFFFLLNETRRKALLTAVIIFK